MKNTLNFNYLHITGNLIGLMASTGKAKVSAAGYTLEKVASTYTLTNDRGEVLDTWEGLPDNKFETTAHPFDEPTDRQIERMNEA